MKAQGLPISAVIIIVLAVTILVLIVVFVILPVIHVSSSLNLLLLAIVRFHLHAARHAVRLQILLQQIQASAKILCLVIRLFTATARYLVQATISMVQEVALIQIALVKQL
ncbi:MAG: hypothetical protein BJBARM5_0384 [Candidatus Parvarchaeum acidophilus ARMAN-5]|uniref:Uncharacterized protein n=1 Tax=Candidatus Parvarchaeum acidophilus ARMAN-5 TaxID=662762 RepID=D6GV77_PARA5|nr:MAG: hypothetical protein BJBARM5_0384 [Candidatus Parvarchaeum acidophilus ARMAN-5]